MAEKVRDLRSALERLKNMPGQLAETDVAVDPMAELAGVYRYVGAGGTVKRPTKEGPAMIFRNIKGHWQFPRRVSGGTEERCLPPCCWRLSRPCGRP